MRTDGEVVIDLKLNSKSFDAQIEQTEKELQEWIQIYEEAMGRENVPEEDLIRYRKEIEKAKNKLLELRKKQEELGQTRVFENIGKSIGDVIKRVAKWGLAIFSIRSAYTMVRNAMSTLSQYDKQLATDVEYIRYVLANLLKPIIEYVVGLVKTIISYVVYIADAWFNISRYADFSAKAFNRANTSATKLKKTLAGFDELNVLNDNGTSGVLSPSFDVSNFDNIEKPEWVKWIADNKELIEAFGAVLLSVFGIANINKILSNIGLLFGASSGKGLVGLLGTLSQIALIGGAIVVTGYVASKLKQEVKELKDWISEVRTSGAEAQKQFVESEENIATLIAASNVNRAAAKQQLQDSKSILLDNLGLSEELLESAKQTAINIGLQIDKEMKLYRASELNKGQQKDLLENIMNQIAFQKDLIAELKRQGKPTGDLVRQNRTMVEYANEIYKNLNNTTEELYDINTMKLNKKTLDVEMNLDTAQAEKDYSNWFTKVGDKIGTWISNLFSGTKIRMGSRAKGGIYYPNYPKLAVGGIVNMPGRGIPYHGAYIGERGAEAVVPLTDSQQMALLGETIGKYITINNVNPIYLSGRQIAREVNRTSSQDDFAYNK